MKFLIDMPLSPSLSFWLTLQGHDSVHAREVGLSFASDLIIIERARIEHRIITTADLDYPRLLSLNQSDSPGLILFRGGNYSEKETVDRLHHVLEIIPNEELSHSIIVIDKDRIRRRSLPINNNL